MGKVWEFYENLNEIVYVTDIDTNELIYMNKKGRWLCNIDDMESLSGKKCHEILQGGAAPCVMCNNDQLKSGEFIEWDYFNPVYKKNFIIKDTLVEEDGRRYRLEVAIDRGQEIDENVQDYIDNEAMLNEGLKISLAAPTPEESLQSLLEFMGKSLKSERCYIFEGEVGGEYGNTYEWCAVGVEPQIDNLRELDFDVVKIWVERFQYNENVIIRNLEDIKESDPAMYDCLKPQDITRLAVCKLEDNGKLIGFYGVDNPPERMLENIATMLQIMGHFITMLIRRRDMYKRLEKLSYYDQLTGLGNRHAMDAYISRIKKHESIGIVYCDLMGLKRVNDNQGHQAGDELLLGASQSLKRTFTSGYSRFRIGGDEFLVIGAGMTEEKLKDRIEALKKDMREHSNVMAIGYVWRENSREDVDKLMAEADELMYMDKRALYQTKEFDRRKR
jgi:diguanylate cyclase (GGDEF)-like protein